MADVALLDASVGDTPAEGNFRRELDADVTTFKVSEGEFPERPDRWDDDWPYDGVVISGSQTEAYDDVPWIVEAREWVRAADERGVPVLGVCWGHQLLGHALGGESADMGDYELGYHEIRTVADSRLFAGMPAEFVAFETHSDEVAELPPGAEVLAENDRTVQAFRLRNSFGVQFHPEVDLETARHLIRVKDLPDERIQRTLDDATPERYEAAKVATRVFDNFLAFAADVADGTPA